MDQGMHEDAFEFVGGYLCLDFANTVGGLRGAIANERLASYADLVRWSYQARLVTDEEQWNLLQMARGAEDAAHQVLRRASTLREAIYAIFTAIGAGTQVDADALMVLNGEVRLALANAQLSASAEGFVWTWGCPQGALDQMIGPIVRSAADLLTSPDVRMVRTCLSESCGWLFVDATKNHRRLWCTMTGCGNKARVRRHRQRMRENQSV